MIRRKIRPLGIAACIAIFLLFQFLRRGGGEVFTFDNTGLPPYTDDGKYVRKPVPEAAPVSLPPPPPQDWAMQPSEHDTIPQAQPAAPVPAAGRPDSSSTQRLLEHNLNNRPASGVNTPSQREPNPHSPGMPPGQPNHGVPGSPNPNTPQQNPVVLEDTEIPFSNPNAQEHAGHKHTHPNQPPAPGDFDSKISSRPLYTAEELAPRVEKYPIPPSEIIPLPKGRPSTLPSVQARFTVESTERQRLRIQRQNAIKRAMQRSWRAYADHAMGHDEVRPISGRFYDPFCGWGATLVDSLDTLQIMGMQEEYRAALQEVEKIDFAHTLSYSIPLFETVIRYLGGLLGAYDVSENKDQVLLDKAKELADMLMGAFDTINRMPLLRYDWRPQAARQNLRASQTSGLAEMGTLTLEFTRLAQLTGNNTYYDAVQRISNGLEDFKFSHVPGLFPIHIDASGCRYEEAETPKQAITVDEDEEESETQLKKRAVLDERQLAETQGRQPDGHLEDTTRANMGNAMRESLTESDSISDEPGPVKRPKEGPSKSSSRRPNHAAQKCEPQGLTPSIWRSAQEFSMGGESDSAYEYFIKEYVLLGGLEDQYRKLYTDSVIAARQNLFYRPLVEGDPDILFSGKFRSYYNDDGTQADGVLMGEMSHLACFVGGMVALGSKILNRPGDMSLAEKLTDGCVWAYNATATGIMPENFHVEICEDEPCHWEPAPHSPFATEPTSTNTTPGPDDLPKLEIDDVDPITGHANTPQSGGARNTGNLNKRAPAPEPAPPIPPSRQGPPIPESPDPSLIGQVSEKLNSESEIDPAVQKLATSRQSATTHSRQRVPKPASFSDYMDAVYILRPEAIESVFYMYRITGDPTWQDKGWKMWESIEEHTWTEMAYSAILDVNDVNSTKSDSMESFWLSETLKYFYLLYSEPNLISLDDWVFNTEAHPFKRPVA